MLTIVYPINCKIISKSGMKIPFIIHATDVIMQTINPIKAILSVARAIMRVPTIDKAMIAHIIYSYSLLFSIYSNTFG
jgi:hypothetical protein